jgi:hypothetical protein
VPAAALKAFDAVDTMDFIETACRITKDSIAGAASERLKLRGWQGELIRHLYAGGVQPLQDRRRDPGIAVAGGLTWEQHDDLQVVWLPSAAPPLTRRSSSRHRPRPAYHLLPWSVQLAS